MILKQLYQTLIFPYSVLLLYLMLFGFGRTVMDDNIVRFKPFFSMLEFAEYNLLFGNYWIFSVNLFGNIFMFVPFGFLGWKFPKLNQFSTLMISFLSSIIIVEALQYFTRKGVFEVDDILLNSLGVYIGYRIKNVIDKKWLVQL